MVMWLSLPRSKTETIFPQYRIAVSTSKARSAVCVITYRICIIKHAHDIVNKLGPKGMEALAPAFGKMKQLTSLNLDSKSRIQIRNLFFEFCSLCFRRYDLLYVPIPSPHSFAWTPKHIWPHTLSHAGNSLGPEGGKHLVSCLPRMSKLKFLHLDSTSYV